MSNQDEVVATFTPYDDMRDDVIGIVTAATRDDTSFWRLVASDVDSRSHLYDEPAGAPQTAAELLDRQRRLDLDGPTAIELARMRVEPPEWRWFRRPVNVDHDRAVNALEGDEGAFYGALIVLKSAHRPHIRIRYAVLGGHTHCSVWTTERGGPDVTHGRNGTLTFRNAEFEAFRKTIEVGMSLAIVSAIADVEFVEDPAQIGLARRDGVVNLDLLGDTPAEATDAR